MTKLHIPEGNDWCDHAEPCPNCGQPVLRRLEHLVSPTQIDPAWWTCDHKEDKPDE